MRTPSFLYSLAFLPLLILPVTTVAMVALEEEEMAGVSGAGLAFVLDDFSMRMAPTSYAELLGSAPTSQAASRGWERGDARYYGLSFTSGSNAGTDWYGNGCTGSDPLNCPMGLGSSNNFGATAFASVFDPFVLRVFEYQGFDYQGNYLTGSSMPTILEFLGPHNTDVWRWAFWGELEVATGGTTPASRRPLGACNNSVTGCSGGADFLQSQTIVHGRPVAKGHRWQGVSSAGADLGYVASTENKPAILRVMRTQNSVDPTLGLTYQSAISGNFRFSVRQRTNAGVETDRLHVVPDFNDDEGLHFKNVDAFLPLGTLHYQALTFSGVSGYDADANLTTPTQNGNFTMELTRIPNDPNIYNHFYCGNLGGAACELTSAGNIAKPNPNTHGYVRWGNWCSEPCSAAISPTATPGAGAYNLPTPTSTANGIYFVGGTSGANPAANVTNIGIARVEGMLIQHLKITTLGAGQ